MRDSMAQSCVACIAAHLGLREAPDATGYTSSQTCAASSCAKPESGEKENPARHFQCQRHRNQGCFTAGHLVFCKTLKSVLINKNY